jgi:hypothetical protein
VAPAPGGGTVTTGTGHPNAALAIAESDDGAPF